MHKEWNMLVGSILNQEISEFIRLGIDINMPIDKVQHTLLHFIADGNHKHLPTEQILNKSKNVNSQDKLGNTPLHYTVSQNKSTPISIIQNRLYIAKKLINRDDIKPNIANKKGKTPLLLALECERKDLIELFLSNKKTDLSIASKEGKAPLHYSAIYEFVDLFTTISNPNIQDIQGRIMKNIMKLSLIIASCISSIAYSAEKLNADQIIREAHATGKPIPLATANQILDQQKKRVAKEGVDFLILWGKPVPEKIIRDADPETVSLAHQHNQKLQQQLHEQQPK